MKYIIFNNPALTPVCSQHSRLIGSRRRPGARRLSYLKAPDYNKICTGSFRIKAASAHTDLRQFLIWIQSLEIGINHGRTIFYFSEPLIQGIFRMRNRLLMFRPRRIISFRPHNGSFQFIQIICLIHGFPIQIYISCMDFSIFRPDQPVSPKNLLKRIIASKYIILHFCFPHIPPAVLPSVHDLRAFDHYMLSRSRLINNSF